MSKQQGSDKLEPGTGRYVKSWDPKMSIEICEEVAEGKSLKEVTAQGTGRCKASTFLHWCLTVPELGAMYKLAREISGHMLEDEALGHARRLSTMGDPTAGKVRALDVAMNQLRWSAGKRNPKEYSDKSAVTFTVPIQINTSLPLSEGEEVLGEDPNAAFTIDLAAVPEPEAPPIAEGPPARHFYDAAKEARAAQDRPGPGRGLGWNKGRAAPWFLERARRKKEERDAKEAAEAASGPLHRGPLDRREVGKQVAPTKRGGVQGVIPGPVPDPRVVGEGDEGGVEPRGDDLPGGRVGGRPDGHKRGHNDPEGVDQPVGTAGKDDGDQSDGDKK